MTFEPHETPHQGTRKRDTPRPRTVSKTPTVRTSGTGDSRTHFPTSVRCSPAERAASSAVYQSRREPAERPTGDTIPTLPVRRAPVERSRFFSTHRSPPLFDSVTGKQVGRRRFLPSSPRVRIEEKLRRLDDVSRSVEVASDLVYEHRSRPVEFTATAILVKRHVPRDDVPIQRLLPSARRTRVPGRHPSAKSPARPTTRDSRKCRENDVNRAPSSGSCRSTTSQMARANFVFGSSPVGNWRFKSPCAPSRRFFRIATSFAFGRTTSFPRSISQPAISLAARYPHCSSPWIPPTTRTVGPSCVPSRTNTPVSYFVPERSRYVGSRRSRPLPATDSRRTPGEERASPRKQCPASHRKSAAGKYHQPCRSTRSEKSINSEETEGKGRKRRQASMYWSSI